MRRVRPGSIIVMHPWWDRERTRLAADTMISLLQARGYRFVTVDRLTALRNAHRGVAGHGPAR